MNDPRIPVIAFLVHMTVAIVLVLTSGCCKPKEGATRGDVIKYQSVHWFGENPFCEGTSDE